MCYYALRTPFSIILLYECHQNVEAAAIKDQIQSTRIYTSFFSFQTIQSRSEHKNIAFFHCIQRRLFNSISFGAPFDVVD